MEKTIYEKLELKSQEQRKLVQKLEAEASNMLLCITQWKANIKHNEMVEANIKKMSLELDSKEKELQSLSSEIDKRVKVFETEKSEAGNLKKMVEDCTEELRSMRDELTAKRDTSARFEREIESKKNHLRQYMAEFQRLCSEAGKVQNHKKEIEEEISRKKKELSLILDQIKESGKQFATVDEQLESQRRQLEMKSLELVSKEEELEHVIESIKHSNSDLEVKEKMVQSLNNQIRVCGQEIDSKSKESGEIQKKVEQQTSEVDVMQDQLDSIKLLLKEQSEELVAKEKRHKEMLERIKRSSSELEEKVKEMKAAETQASDLNVRSVRLRQDVEDKEKRVHELNNLITVSSEELDVKSKELGEIQRELELKKQLKQMMNRPLKREKQSAAKPNNDNSQHNAEETEDSLMHHEFSASPMCHEISSLLIALPNPAEYVLELVQEYISEGSVLQDLLLENLVLLFEELVNIQLLDKLAKIQRPDKLKLQLQAQEVATTWKGNITIEAPKSSLEVLAFLMFIVAYGLQKMINEEETALLASSIAQYQQASRLFICLSLNPDIREFVKELIKKSLYIPAARVICSFKLNREFSSSPSELLLKEIINLRRSALENKSADSSQAKEKDVVGRLRAILELVADYEIEINLPGDLIVKLMLQRESSTALDGCSLEHGASSSNPHDVLVKHNGVEEENLGLTMSSHVNSINKTSKSKHPPVMFTYQRRGK
ncbi:unnamed protein product [Cochlearia groenlandica]